MTLVLVLIYGALGFVMGLAAACALGFAVSSVIALVRISRRPGNWWLLVLYSAGAIGAGAVCWGGLFIAGMIGDRTGYSSQIVLAIAAGIVGVLSVLPIVGGFAGVALAQTSGAERD